MADAKTLVQIILLLPGEQAAKVRMEASRVFAGNLGNAFARLHCHRNRMVCCLLPVKKLGVKKWRADRSLGNAFARLHCCRHDMVCCLLRSKKLRARKQPWTLIGDRQKTRYKSYPYY